MIASLPIFVCVPVTARDRPKYAMLVRSHLLKFMGDERSKSSILLKYPFPPISSKSLV